VRPTRQDLEAARARTLPDVIAPGLAVLFCGINPGLYSAALGYHFARPGNRFWPALHAAGVTPRILRPEEHRLLLEYRCGLTDIVERASARADELTRDELVAGRHRLEAKLARFEPHFVAVLGIGAYRKAFGKPGATLGLQRALLGRTRVWVLPNPSGLNAAYQPRALATAFRALYQAATRGDDGGARPLLPDRARLA
jgi:double-stranded uracil-DNA glycosylase